MQETEFRFRLNGEIVPEIFIQRAMVDGEPVGEWQISETAMPYSRWE